MVLDIRASVTCTLGEVISASISDEYVQGTGLIKYSGSCEINDLITPAIGTAVTFSYTKNGITRTIPRKLRVLSSFADPFRRTTRVELGCKLTYLADKREPKKWRSPYEDEQNQSDFEDAGIYKWILPYHASSIMNKCLAELGLAASSNPLTSIFLVEEFDYSNGWVDVLSSLLVSESYCGYLDQNEILQVFPLDQTGGSGPVLDASSLIDIAQIGVGQLPAESVITNYTSSYLEEEIPDTGLQSGDVLVHAWFGLRTSSRHSVSGSSNSSSIAIPYEREYPSGTTEQLVAYYELLDTSTTLISTTVIETQDPEDRERVTSKELIASRTTTELRSAAGIAGAYATASLSVSGSFGNYQVSSETSESFAYDEDGNEILRTSERRGDVLYMVGALGLPYSFTEFDGSRTLVTIPDGRIVLELIVTATRRSGGVVTTTTYRYAPWWETPQGQQSVSEARNAFQSAGQVYAYLQVLAGAPLCLIGVSTTFDSDPSLDEPNEELPTGTSDNKLPSKSKQAASVANRKTYKNTSSFVYSVGSTTAQRRIEFNLPYATTDGIIVKRQGGPVVSRIKGDPESQARRYGRVQNRLLAGNRNGMNIQTAPELLPAAPFSPFIIQANGVSGMYRTNGTSWTMSSEGVVVATDALFWGGVGGTGTFWFPVAPGITTLPETPPVVDGQMTVNSVVPIWNETVLIRSDVKCRCTVQSFNYSMTPPLASLTLGVRTQVEVRRVVAISTPVVDVAVAVGDPPLVVRGASASSPAFNILALAVPPAVTGGASVSVPFLTVTLAAIEPQQAGRLATAVQVPSTGVLIGAPNASTSIGKAVSVPAATIALEAVPPAKVGAVQSYFSSLSRQVYDGLRDFRVDWWAD